MGVETLERLVVLSRTGTTLLRNPFGLVDSVEEPGFDRSLCGVPGLLCHCGTDSVFFEIAFLRHDPGIRSVNIREDTRIARHVVGVAHCDNPGIVDHEHRSLGDSPIAAMHGERSGRRSGHAVNDDVDGRFGLIRLHRSEHRARVEDRTAGRVDPQRDLALDVVQCRTKLVRRGELQVEAESLEQLSVTGGSDRPVNEDVLIANKDRFRANRLPLVNRRLRYPQMSRQERLLCWEVLHRLILPLSLGLVKFRILG